jgi:hypothetical protein
MNENSEIQNLSIEIREKTRFSPNSQSIKQFDFRLKKIDIKELIIYNFINQNGTWLRELMLSTFEYWKCLNLKDWKFIFTKIEGNELGEYYMNGISKTYLGIDPKFRNDKGIRERLFPKKYRQTKKTVEFIENLKTHSIGMEHQYLENN